ncbi:MAG TPA: S41 family peptidase, partial [Sporomusaceae bacterium]|nr:S41 family peptidase [Sporomusaceae bacterium]
MSRRKIIFGAIAIVVATVLLMSSLFVYLLQSTLGDAAGAIRLFRAMQIIKARYVKDAP